MNDLAKIATDYAWLIDILEKVVALGGALLVIRGWVKKPNENMKKSLDAMKLSMDTKMEDYGKELNEFMASQKTLMHDQLERQMNQECVLNFLVSDRLATAHDYWTRKGFCPEPDRSRLKDMYNAHHMRGQNHLSESFLDDIDKLPKSPPKDKYPEWGGTPPPA